MMLRIPALGAALGLVASSCMFMSDHTASLREALNEGRAENAAHADHCAVTRTMADMSSEMQRHDVAIDGVFAEMMNGMDTMNECSCCDTSGMRAMMDGLTTMESDHRRQMGSTADVTQARFLCRSHTEAMRQKMDQMDSTAAGYMGN